MAEPHRMQHGIDVETKREPSALPASNALGLSEDLLRGAEEIAVFLFGSKQHRRKVYHLAETSRLPVFRLGSVLCARRSVLMRWIAEQEKRACRADDVPR